VSPHWIPGQKRGGITSNQTENLKIGTTLKALVTGARGFIGNSLVPFLLERNWAVSCLLRRKSLHDNRLSHLPVQIIEGDITQPETLIRAVQNVDVIFHLAGATKARNEGEYFEINAGGTRNLLEAVRSRNIKLKRFILISSLAAAGPSSNGERKTEGMKSEPISFYGKSKLKAEEFTWSYAEHFPVTIIRPPVVFGPREKDMFLYFQLAQKGWQPLIGGGPRCLSLIYVKDLVRGILESAESKKTIQKLYYLCNDLDVTWEELGAEIAASLGKKTKKMTVPVSLAFVASALSDCFGRLTGKLTILNLDKYKELKATHWICDASSARRDFNFQTHFALNDALKETAAWYKEEGWLT